MEGRWGFGCFFFCVFSLVMFPGLKVGRKDWGSNGKCDPLPAPSNVSISSFNMEHTLSFLPGPETPPDTHFTVQILNPRKSTWKEVASCSELTAGQTCDLTRAFQEPFDHYYARVQAFTPTQKSDWKISRQFQPLSDTVMGPLDVSVSGCGNCLLVQVSLPKSKGLQQHQQFQSFYRVIDFNVQRTRDGVQFKLKLPYKEENMITYLQPGVEYCVTVSVSSPFNSNSVPNKPFCAFTSPPPRNLLYLVYGLLGAFCVLVFLLMGLVVHGGRLSYQLLGQRIPRSLLYIALQDRGGAPPELSDQTSAPQIHNRGSADRLHSPQSCPPTEEQL
ncbi:interferon alpha/beta receptor 2-like isoform X2 [Thunnus albacares]|uniref:interferon alpha/beta receptor 2-like isoform X2 n=1 Tax=Thunnus albacares TaxID=8236 RepID=UPI001CF68F07|nr:interferon alpha/beta receptor 2-like isoform X2 [Thunnus albacares]